MITRPLAVILCVLCVVTGGCRQKQQPEANAKAVAPRPKNFATQWQTESEYIVESIATDLARMAGFASAGCNLQPDQITVAAVEVPATSKGGLSYKITVTLPGQAPFDAVIVIDDAIWSPSAYLPLSRQLLERLQIKPSTTGNYSDNHALLRALTEPTATVIAHEDNTLSARLNSDFKSPELHEQAALLLTSFSLREHSGYFYEIRAELCRITAHLAFANALRGKAAPSPEGEIAKIALTALSGNQTSALTLLSRVKQKDDSVAAWCHAIHFRITSDYRPSLGKTPTLLERLERFRAKSFSLGENSALSDLASDDEIYRLPDWTRIINCVWPSVGVGHRILDFSLKAEMDEGAAVYAAVTQKELTPENIEPVLNIEPSPCISCDGSGTAVVKIISWGHWAGAIQRHLCHAIQHDFNFLQRNWGVPERAREYKKWTDATLGKLRLYPFVRRLNAIEEIYYRMAQDDAIEIVRLTPHLIPTGVWIKIFEETNFCPIYLPQINFPMDEWYQPNPLPGTAYDIFPRLTHQNLYEKPDYSVLIDRLHSLAPFDRTITHYFLLNSAKLAGKPSAPIDEIEAAYSPLTDYDYFVDQWIAKSVKEDPKAQEKWLRKTAELQPTALHELADFLVTQNRSIEAAETYEKAFAQDPDSVRVANKAVWLILHYEDTGRPVKATQLASFAAGVYSYEGLVAKARLLEKRGDFDGALAICQQANERYNAPDCILHFLIRYKIKVGDAHYDSSVGGIVAKTFPLGLEKIEPKKLSNSPPADGVIMNNESALSKQFGLKMTDVIVGMRGIRTHDFPAYRAIRDALPSTPFTLCIWRKDHYEELFASPPENLFGVDMRSYQSN